MRGKWKLIINIPVRLPVETFWLGGVSHLDLHAGGRHEALVVVVLPRPVRQAVCGGHHVVWADHHAAAEVADAMLGGT